MGYQGPREERLISVDNHAGEQRGIWTMGGQAFKQRILPSGRATDWAVYRTSPGPGITGPDLPSPPIRAASRPAR